MEIEVIKANDLSEVTSRHRRIEKLRVAAYCRVSTNDEDQQKSYNSMVRYYTDLIKNNKQWIFVDVYADEAVTGTKTDKREDFKRLIQDCLDGKIDMVIAKSIPRFARNTLDTLKYVRMLKQRNIAIYFEAERIHSLKNGEFLLTILSSVAQQEVENISLYVWKGLQMKMSRGELVGFSGCQGYDYDAETDTISINEAGAEIVKYIFDRYVAGAGSSMIAKELNAMGKTTTRNNPWTSSSVLGIIKNEKYIGDVRQGKTFTTDPISKQRLTNMGEQNQYYIKAHHEPIISKETFMEAQDILSRRNGGKKSATPGKREKFSRQYAFSCMLECGFCGANLSRRSWHSNSKYQKTTWQCVKNTKHGKQYCPDSKGIPEKVIEDAFIESYRMLSVNNKDVLEEFLQRTEKALQNGSIEERLKKYQKNADSIQRKRKLLLERYMDDVITEDMYRQTDEDYLTKLSETTTEIELLEKQIYDRGSLKKRIAEFKVLLSENQVLEEFDRGIFESVIEKVIVGGYDEEGKKDPYKLTFIYKTGFKNEIEHSKEKYKCKDKNSGGKTLCSCIANEVKCMCSDMSDAACGDGGCTTSDQYVGTYRKGGMLSSKS